VADALEAMAKGAEDSLPRTKTLPQAMRDGEGVVTLEVTYEVKYRDPNREDKVLVPKLDELGNKITLTGRVRIQVMGGEAFILDKFDDRRPPHIHASDTMVELRPEDNFDTPRDTPRFPREVRDALNKRYEDDLEAERKAVEEAERKAETEATMAFAQTIADRATLRATDVMEALNSGPMPEGVVGVNNPRLRMNPSDRNSLQFHLAFSMSVEASGVCRLGNDWYSSEKSVDLSPLIGRDLMLEKDEKGFLRVTDPNLPSLEGLEGDELEKAKSFRYPITRACARVKGALIAQKAYEDKHPVETQVPVASHPN
jgi:hypothetical protein